MILFTADHGGFAMKEKLRAWATDRYGQEVLDLARKRVAGDDYPERIQDVVKVLRRTKGPVMVIAICRSGVGMAMAANRHHGLRALQGLSAAVVKRGREEEDANVLSLGADLVTLAQAKKITQAFLETSFRPLVRYRRRLLELDRHGKA